MVKCVFLADHASQAINRNLNVISYSELNRSCLYQTISWTGLGLGLIAEINAVDLVLVGATMNCFELYLAVMKLNKMPSHLRLHSRSSSAIFPRCSWPFKSSYPT